MTSSRRRRLFPIFITSFFIFPALSFADDGAPSSESQPDKFRQTGISAGYQFREQASGDQKSQLHAGFLEGHNSQLELDEHLISAVKEKLSAKVGKEDQALVIGGKTRLDRIAGVSTGNRDCWALFLMIGGHFELEGQIKGGQVKNGGINNRAEVGGSGEAGLLCRTDKDAVFMISGVGEANAGVTGIGNTAGIAAGGKVRYISRGIEAEFSGSKTVAGIENGGDTLRAQASIGINLFKNLQLGLRGELLAVSDRQNKGIDPSPLPSTHPVQVSADVFVAGVTN